MYYYLVSCAALENWVKKGKDEDGEKKKNWLIKELFGVKVANRMLNRVRVLTD